MDKKLVLMIHEFIKIIELLNINHIIKLLHVKLQKIRSLWFCFQFEYQ